jgi:hypothetical protein
MFARIGVRAMAQVTARFRVITCNLTKIRALLPSFLETAVKGLCIRNISAPHELELDFPHTTVLVLRTTFRVGSPTATGRTAGINWDTCRCRLVRAVEVPRSRHVRCKNSDLKAGVNHHNIMRRDRENTHVHHIHS